MGSKMGVPVLDRIGCSVLVNLLLNRKPHYGSHFGDGTGVPSIDGSGSCPLAAMPHYFEAESFRAAFS